MIGNKKIWSVTTGVSCFLLAVAITGLAVTSHYETSITNYLGIVPYKVVKGNSNVDTDYYPDEWKGYDKYFENYEQSLCEQTEAEGAVLIKNETVNGKKALPLKEAAKISFFSHSSVDIVYTGTGSGSVDTVSAPNLRKAFQSRGFEVNSDLWTFYNTGAGSSYKRSVPSLDTCTAKGDYKINETPWDKYTQEVKDSFVGYGDAAIFVLSRSGGEGGDLARTTAKDEGTNGNYLALSTAEKEVLSKMKEYKDKGTFKEIVVLINSSNAVDCDFLDDPAYGIDACLWVGGPGAYGTNAIADIFAGKANPSGRLADTFLKQNLNGPSLYNFGDCTYSNASAVGLKDTDDTNNTNVNYVVYQEGIYVGYKYYETRYADVVTGRANAGSFNYDDVVYRPFGYGLSYTDFEYSNYEVKENSDSYTISVNVKNVGDVAGKHTVEAYLQKPYTQYDIDNGIEKSAVELVGFAKTNKIKPGSSEKVSINVKKESMKSYDANGAKTYIVDAGDYYLGIGKDSHDALKNIMKLKNENTEGNEKYAKKVATVNKLDTTTYAKSQVTGNEITNQFDFADINKYDGISEKVTYLSRNNWEGTIAKATIQLTATEKLAKDVKDEYVSKEGYTKPTYGAQNGLTLAMFINNYDFNDPAWDDLLDQMTFEEQEKLVVYGFHSTDAVGSIGKPATKETNGPQGITNSFFGGGSPGMAYPAETVMCATWNTKLMEEIGKCIGIQGLKSNTNGVYGPGANIHRNAYCGRNYEYYSEDAILSGLMMAPEIRGIQSQGVYVQMKHLGLNDQETHRGGVMTWANEQTIREAYMPAFELGVREGKAQGAMTVMNRIGAIWGGSCESIHTSLMIDEWGYEGYTITDYSSSSNFTSVINGIEAGVSLWDGYTYGETNTPKLKDLSNDAYACQMLRKAVKRILYVQAHSSAMNGIAADDIIIPIEPWYITLFKGTVIGFSVTLTASIALLVLVIIDDKKKKPLA